MLRAVILSALLLVPSLALAICEVPLVSDTSRVSKAGDNMTGTLWMIGAPITMTGSGGYITGGSSITTSGSFFGPLVGNVTGNCSGTAAALAATGTPAPSGYVSRGIDASGNALPAFVESNALGVSGSTSPWSAGAAYTAYTMRGSSGTNADITALNALGTSKSTPTFTGSLGLGCGTTGTRRLNLCFSANNNAISYGDEAVTYCDPGNGLCISLGGLYGKGALYIQGHNGLGGTKKPLGLNPEGGGVSIGGYSPTSSTSTLEVVGGLSVAGTLEAKALKGDGSAITGIGGALAGLTANYGLVATGANTAGNGNFYETSTGTSHNLPFLSRSTVTVGVVGGGVYTSTADYSAALKGGCYLIAVSSVNNATGLIFTNISSDTYSYFMTFASAKITQGVMKLTIGGDETSVYINLTQGVNSAGSALSNVGALAYLDLFNSGYSPADASYFAGRVDFQRADKVSKQVAMGGWSLTQSILDSSHYAGATLRALYTGTASMTSIAIKASAGTFTGYWELYACTSGLTH